MFEGLTGITRWLVSSVVLPDNRAKIASRALLAIHLSPRLKSLMIVLIAVAFATLWNLLTPSNIGAIWLRAIVVGTVGYAALQLPLLPVMHHHSQRRWTSLELDYSLAKCLSGYGEAGHWIATQAIDDSFCRGLIQDIRNAAGSIYLCSPNGIYLYADEVHGYIANHLDQTVEANAAKAVLECVRHHSRDLREAFAAHKGTVFFMLPEYRDVGVRAACAKRRYQINISPSLDKAVGKVGRRILNRIWWTRVLKGEETRIVRIPHLCCARTLLIGEKIYIQPFLLGRHGITEYAGIITRASNPEQYARIRSIILGFTSNG